MRTAEAIELKDVLDRVKNWPEMDRIRLARMILETVETDLASEARRYGSLNDVLGILKTDVPPPTDEECDRIIEEERMRKYGGGR